MRVLAAVAAALFVVGSATSVMAWPTWPKVGQPAPDFTVTTFGGRTVKLADLKGDVIVLNFWATWCAPCRKELPTLDARCSGPTPNTACRCSPSPPRTRSRKKS